MPLVIAVTVLAVTFAVAAALAPSTPLDTPVDAPSGASDHHDVQTAGPEIEHLDCTPGAATSLSLSEPSGFVGEPFELTLDAPASARPIRYTLDGSTPDPVANPEATVTYTGPITVDGEVVADPPISAIRTAIDDEHAPEGSAGPPLWDLRAPEGQTATVVRARSANGKECVGVYFVGDDLVRDDLAVIHLTVDADHLFDHETGIHVPGVAFDEYAASDEYDPAEPARRMPGNFDHRGRAWERPAVDELSRPVLLHLFEPGGELGFQQALGLRIHGGVSRSWPQKSFRLYARNDYGARTFDYPFFGDGGPTEHRRLILRNSGNDWRRTMLLDGYLHDVVAELPIDTQAYRPAATFINGEYWGILNVRERYDRHYLAITHGVDPDRVVILNGDLTVNTGVDADADDFRELLDHVARGDLSDPEAFRYVADRMDLDDLIDYLIVQVFVSNTDWPGTNAKVWRERVEPGRGEGPRDGRWRWLLYDLDHLGAHQRDPTHDQLARLAERAGEADRWTGIPSLLDNLLDAPPFREAFESRFHELLGTTLHPDRTVPMLRERAARIEQEVVLHGERWDTRDADAWRRGVAQIERYMAERPDHQREHLRRYLAGR